MRIPTAGIVFGLSVVALDARVLPQQGSPPADAACSVVAVRAKAPADTTITSAAWVEATPTAPRHCLVDGQRGGAWQQVSFRVGLPANWNGKFYFSGHRRAGRHDRLARRRVWRAAMRRRRPTPATTPPIRTGAANRAKEIDYGHRGTHVTAVAAKALTAALLRRSRRRTPTSTAVRTAAGRR